MRLAAPVDVELEPAVRSRSRASISSASGASSPTQHAARTTARRSRSDRRRRRATIQRSSPAATARPSSEREPVSLGRRSTPSTVASRDAMRDLAAASTSASASRIACSFASMSARGVELERGGDPLGHRVASRSPARPSSTRAAAFSAREEDVGVVREHDHVVGVDGASIASRICPTDGFIVCPPSITIALPSLREDLPVPAALRDRDERDVRRRRLRRCVQLRRAIAPARAAWLCMSPISTRAPRRARPRARGRAPAPARPCGRAPWRPLVARRRAASRRAARAARGARRDRAPRPRRRRPCSSGTPTPRGGSTPRVSSSVDVRDLGQRLARQTVEDPRTISSEPRAARVDDAGLAQLVEQLGRPRDCVLAPRDDPRQALRRPAARARRAARPPRPSRG